MAWTLLLGFIALTLVFVWMVVVRYQIEVLADRVGDEELEVSLAERRAEGDRRRRRQASGTPPAGPEPGAASRPGACR